RDHALAWPDDRYRFGGGEEAILVQLLVDRRLVPLAEEALEVLLRHVAMPRRDVDDELGGSRSRGTSDRPGTTSATRAKPFPPGVAHQPFDSAAVQGHHCRKSSLEPDPATMSRTCVSSIRPRWSLLRPASTISVSIEDCSHRNASDCLPSFW